MKKLLFRAALLAVIMMFAASLSSCGSGNDPYAAPAGMISASDEKADFCLFVPDDWTIDYSTAAAGAYFSTSDPSSVSVMAWELEYTDTTLDDWWALNVDEISVVFDNFILESEENITMNELYGKKYVYTADLGEYSYKIMQAACIKDASVYLFTYTSLPDNYEAHLEDVNQMIEYFVIK